eukprot:gene19970-26680_t
MEIEPRFPAYGHPDFECAKSLVHPRGVSGAQSFSGTGGEFEIGKQAMRSTALFSSDTLTAASMGFRVSSRLMSILRPSLSRQSIASSDSPPSSTHLPRTVSLLGGSPRGRRSLCLPATSKKTSSRSATTSAVFTPTLPGRRLKHSLSMKAVKRRTTIGDLPSHPRSATWAGSSVDIDDPPLDDHDISLRGGLVSSAVQPGMTIEPRYPSAIDDHDISLRWGDFECAKSLVHPRGVSGAQSFSGTGGEFEIGKQAMRSTALFSSDTLTAASMGFRVSSRLMSILRPSLSRQSIASSDSPPSSTHLPRTVSLLGGSPRGRRSLCLPATSKKTSSRSATTSAVFTPTLPGRRLKHSLSMKAVKRRTTIGDLPSHPRSATWAGSSVDIDDPPLDDHDISLRGGLVSSAVQPGMTIEPRYPSAIDDHDISLRWGVVSSAQPGMEIEPRFPAYGHPDFECAKSLVHPRGVSGAQSFSGTGGEFEIGKQAMRSTALFSSDTLTAASMGFRVSSRLMSILRPSLSRQSIASSDSPPSSTHLPRTVSLLGGSPRGRRSLCLPATSKKTSSRSATTSAVFTPTLPGRRLKHSLSMKAVKRRTTIGDLPSHPRSATWAGSSVDIDDPPLDDHDISLRGGLVSSAVQPGMTIEPRYPSAIDDHDISLRWGVVSSAQPGMEIEPRFPAYGHPDFECAKSLVHPRGVSGAQSFSGTGGEFEIGKQAMRSTALFSSDTLTAASMGFRVSSRLMSILRPSLSRQSIASSDSPPSSTHLPRTVSLLGGSPRGRRSLCLPATSKKTSSRSATTSAVFTPTLPGRRLKHSLSMKAVKRRTTIGDLPSHPRSATWAGSSVDIDDPPLDDHDISLRGGLVSSAVQPGMTIEPRYPSAIDDHDISLRWGVVSSAQPGMEIEPRFPAYGHPDFECAKSLVHPRGVSGAQSFSGTGGEFEIGKQAMRLIASSSFNAFSGAGMGFQVSTHIMSSKQPTNDQQSFDSLGSPLSKTHLLQEASQLGGSPFGSTGSLGKQPSNDQRPFGSMDSPLSRTRLLQAGSQLGGSPFGRRVSPGSSTRLTQTFSHPCRSQSERRLSSSVKSLTWSTTTEDTVSLAEQSGRETPIGVPTGGQPGRETPIGFPSGGQPDLEAEKKPRC